jgi:hypothetical protein
VKESEIPIAEWTPAPRGIPTSADRLAMVLRVFARDRVNEVGIFAHGTALIRLKSASASLEELMRRYDVPFGGAGSPLGDVHPTCFDDGSVIYWWGSADPTAHSVTCLTAGELEIAAPFVKGQPPRPPLPDDAILLSTAGLWARHRRTLDARQPVRIAYWSAA